ncbi:MAG TPA: hypothetical protein DDZ51_04780 [Planctomycetaceae bacterium]|nr:hypothetical protein [Planctomycetaceae bacterium]
MWNPWLLCSVKKTLQEIYCVLDRSSTKTFSVCWMIRVDRSYQQNQSRITRDTAPRDNMCPSGKELLTGASPRVLMARF